MAYIGDNVNDTSYTGKDNGSVLYQYNYPTRTWSYTYASEMYRQVVVSRTRHTTPNFATLVHLGILLPRYAHSFRKDVYTGSRGFYRMTNQGPIETNPYYVDQTWTGWVNQRATYQSMDLSSAFTANDKAAIDRKALAQVYSRVKQSRINLAQAYAERHQLAKMMSDITTGLSKAIRSMKRGDVISAMNEMGNPLSNRKRKKLYRTKDMASKWLALQYGVKPLLDDIHGAAQLLAESQYAPYRCEAVGRSKRSQQAVRRNTVPPGGSQLGGSTGTVEVSGNYSVKYTVVFDDPNPVLSLAASTGLTNPALLAWELMPFSFVIDWLLPIGNWLASMDSTLGLRVLEVSKTTFEQGSLRQSEVQPWTSYLGYWYRRDYSKSQVWTKMTREILADLPGLPVPSIKNPISGLHIANSLALLLTSIKK